MLRDDPAHRRSHVTVLEDGPGANGSLTSEVQHAGENTTGARGELEFVVHTLRPCCDELSGRVMS